MSEEKNEVLPEEVTPVVEPVVEEVTPVVEPVVEQEVIAVPEEDKAGKGLGEVNGGAIGSVDVKSKSKKKAVVVKEAIDTVALNSNRNISWDGVGRLKKGINIVTAEEAAKWTELKGVELVSPEQVAKEFGN